MRKNASSWLIKLMLALICLSFALFFGYSAYRGGVGGNAAAMVGEHDIPLEQFQRSYDEALRRLQEDFAEGLPAEMTLFLKSNILEQLINREVSVLFAQSLGFRIGNEAIARIIRNQPQFYVDGVFNRDYYQKQFRPFYRRRYGLDYEQAIRQDLLIEQLRTFEKIAQLQLLEEANWVDNAEKLRWSFSVIRVPDDALQKNLSETQESASGAEALLKTWIAEWKKGPLSTGKLEKLNASLETGREVGLFNRREIVNGPISPQQIQKIFELNQENPVYNEALRIGSDWYLIKLDAMITNDEAQEWDYSERIVSNPSETFKLWLDDFRQHLEIETNSNL